MSEPLWDVPESWAWSTLEYIAEWASGGTPTSTEPKFYHGQIPWLIIGDLNDGVVTNSSKKITRLGLESSSAKMVKKGAILIAMYGSIGKLGIAGMKCSTNQAIAFTESVHPDLESKYLFYYLLLARTQLNEVGKGGAQQNISQTVLKAFPICIAPLNEQRRIVAKLDKLLSRVDVVQARLAEIPRILKRFRQSVLAAACSGRLTADWRAAQIEMQPASTFLQALGLMVIARENQSDKFPDFPESWAVINFGSIVTSIRGGSTAVPQNELTPFPILRSSSVRPGFVTLDDVKYVSVDDSHNELNYLCDGDLLFTRLSGSLEYVANCATVRVLNGKRIQYPDRLFCAKLIPQVSGSYCELIFAAPFIRSLIAEHAKSSAGHQRISISDITNQVIPIPPLAEQQEIVRRVEALLKTADTLEARYRKAKAHIDKLTQSILARAFRGELVPQDPTDEPAAELLARIEREKSNQPRRRTKP